MLLYSEEHVLNLRNKIILLLLSLYTGVVLLACIVIVWCITPTPQPSSGLKAALDETQGNMAKLIIGLIFGVAASLVIACCGIYACVKTLKDKKDKSRKVQELKRKSVQTNMAYENDNYYQYSIPHAVIGTGWIEQENRGDSSVSLESVKDDHASTCSACQRYKGLTSTYDIK